MQRSPYVPRRCRRTTSLVVAPISFQPALFTDAIHHQTALRSSSLEPRKRHSTPGSGGGADGNFGWGEEPRLDVDYDDQDEANTNTNDDKSSFDETKRQTVIAVKMEPAKVEPFEMLADPFESPAFIHVELPLFPLSAFVPRTLQEAALKVDR